MRSSRATNRNLAIPKLLLGSIPEALNFAYGRFFDFSPGIIDVSLPARSAFSAASANPVSSLPRNRRRDVMRALLDTPTTTA